MGLTDKLPSELWRGSLDLLVLSVLADQPRYGYLIQKCLDQATAGQVRLPAGTLYPLLHRLEAEKLIRSSWDDSTGRRRKWYEITAKGKKRLIQQAHQWEQYARCVADVIGSFVRPIVKPA